METYKVLTATTAAVDPFGRSTRACTIGVMQARYVVKELIPELVKISKAFMQGRWHALCRQSDSSVLKHLALKKYGKWRLRASRILTSAAHVNDNGNYIYLNAV